MKTLIIKTNSFICIIICLMLSPSLISQAVYDTLYSFPDTTTFYNTSIIIVDDIINIAVKFNVDSAWEYYQIEKILFSIPTYIDTNGFSYLNVSIGDLPEDSILLEKQIFYRDVVCFPEITVLRFEEPVLINNKRFFYLSGPLFTSFSISDLYENGIPEQYAYWWSLASWTEYVPYYFNLKVVVKKNLTDVYDAKTLPTEFSLEQNFPNPFNSQSKIIYNSPEMGEAKLSIYDILGNKIYSDLNNSVVIGQNLFAVNSKNIVSGVYFYNVIVNNKYSSTKKMILLK